MLGRAFYLIFIFMFYMFHSYRDSTASWASLFVQALNEDAQAVFMCCPGREFILCLSIYQGRPFHTVPSHCAFKVFVKIYRFPN